MRTLSRTQREWPPTVVAHRHWANDYAKAAAGGGVNLQLGQAVEHMNAWIAFIETAHRA
jgi:hypothetical protein